MLDAKLRGQVDKVWNEFWTGGISNPLEITWESIGNTF